MHGKRLQNLMFRLGMFAADKKGRFGIYTSRESCFMAQILNTMGTEGGPIWLR